MKPVALLFLAIFAALNSGCTLLIGAQLKGKIPFRSADEATASVSIPIIGGGSVAVTGLEKLPDGALKVGTFDEKIQTGYGTVSITGKNAVIEAPATGEKCVVPLPVEKKPN